MLPFVKTRIAFSISMHITWVVFLQRDEPRVGALQIVFPLLLLLVVVVVVVVAVFTALYCNTKETATYTPCLNLHCDTVLK